VRVKEVVLSCGEKPWLVLQIRKLAVWEIKLERDNHQQE
jgi:hypothetical protein